MDQTKNLTCFLDEFGCVDRNWAAPARTTTRGASQPPVYEAAPSYPNSTEGFIQKNRNEDPDPVGSVDFWSAGSGSVTFFILPVTTNV